MTAASKSKDGKGDLSNEAGDRLPAFFPRMRTNALLLQTHRDAWTKVKGTSTEDAKSQYVAHFISLLDKDGSETSKGLKAQVRPPLPLLPSFLPFPLQST